ncbi:CvpA family protein [Sphingomonas sp.]|jgi:membrane protein required for colicin V production|uniref:CvpA family protein n=1 Tax=Sphingomonas sp. TaxID=28214 RepID=UPI002E30B57E|nr:CvpA family protein [Sphingomonas sp.]HEX4693897.1 CvpA family protein [Sphingomonas sp.]
MGLHTLDILVLLGVGISAGLGAWRGFVTEVLSLFAWVLVVFALKLVHAPVTQALSGFATATGAAVLAFALITGAAWFGGRMLAQSIGRRTRSSVLGPIDRAMGFGFGALKGLILASLAFLLVALVTDTAAGGPKQRPLWLTKARTYPLLNATSAYVADVIGKRRAGRPMFGGDEGNVSDAVDNGSDDAAPAPKPSVTSSPAKAGIQGHKRHPK